MVRKKDGIRVMAVEGLAKESEAYSRGMRPGMIVKTMIEESGRQQDESNLAAMSMQEFQAIISSAHGPTVFVMLESAKASSAARITEEHKHSAAAHALETIFEHSDQQHAGEGTG
jgi:hypothetical protein